MAPRIIWPIGRAVGAGIHSDACSAGGGLTAAALFSGQMSEFAGLLEGAAGQLLLGSVKDTDEISALEMFAMVAAVAA